MKHIKSLRKRDSIITGNFDTITKGKSKNSVAERYTHGGAKNWNDKLGCVKARLPVKGVREGVGS